MGHTFESAAAPMYQLRELRAEFRAEPADAGADRPFQICVGGPVTSRDDVRRWEDLGVTRLVVAPWSRSREAVAGLRRYAERVGLTPRPTLAP